MLLKYKQFNFFKTATFIGDIVKIIMFVLFCFLVTYLRETECGIFAFFDFYLFVTLLIFGGLFILFFIKSYNFNKLFIVSFTISIILFGTFVEYLYFYDFFFEEYQMLIAYNLKIFNINFNIGVDGLSLWFILLTTLIVPVVIFYNYGLILTYFKEYLFLLLVLEWLMLNVFLVTNFILFFIFFESILIPMFLIIGIWGSRRRKIHAGYQFLLYTIFGSVFMISALFIIFTYIGSCEFNVFENIYFHNNIKKLIFIFIFISLSIKIPTIPFHLWLPEAHVEAPTGGSIILAGILLKLGSYGMLRILVLIFSDVIMFFMPFILTLLFISVFYGACSTLRQIDLKKVIAYSSIVHMNFALLGLFSLTIDGLKGSIFLMLSHGLVSSLLFLCVGVLYDRYHTRNLKYYNGLNNFMPLYSIIFFFATIANMGIPGSSSFISEFLILIGLIKTSFLLSFLSGLLLIFGVLYAIWLYNRIIFGQINKSILIVKDLTLKEFVSTTFLILSIFGFGLNGHLILNEIEVKLTKILILFLIN